MLYEVITGIDAAHKLTILASIAFGIPLQFDKVYTEGISDITREDVEYAEEFGYRIKHLGFTRITSYNVCYTKLLRNPLHYLPQS